MLPLTVDNFALKAVQLSCESASYFVKFSADAIVTLLEKFQRRYRIKR